MSACEMNVQTTLKVLEGLQTANIQDTVDIKFPYFVSALLAKGLEDVRSDDTLVAWTGSPPEERSTRISTSAMPRTSIGTAAFADQQGLLVRKPTKSGFSPGAQATMIAKAISSMLKISAAATNQSLFSSNSTCGDVQTRFSWPTSTLRHMKRMTPALMGRDPRASTSLIPGDAWRMPWNSKTIGME